MGHAAHLSVTFYLLVLQSPGIQTPTNSLYTNTLPLDDVTPEVNRSTVSPPPFSTPSRPVAATPPSAPNSTPSTPSPIPISPFGSSTNATQAHPTPNVSNASLDPRRMSPPTQPTTGSTQHNSTQSTQAKPAPTSKPISPPTQPTTESSQRNGAQPPQAKPSPGSKPAPNPEVPAPTQIAATRRTIVPATSFVAPGGETYLLYAEQNRHKILALNCLKLKL
jgi:hypothetical protein